jgi:hypothetical protein
MRKSGLSRLAIALNNLISRGGTVSGAVGVDGEITSIEALEDLQRISSDSTVFYTVSGFIYHPKIYLLSGKDNATAVVGSPNLTREGLYRNIEFAVAVNLDLSVETDASVFRKFESVVAEFLNTSHPNVKRINNTTLAALAGAGIVKREAEGREPGPSIRATRRAGQDNPLEKMFPPISVPVAPPAMGVPVPVITTTSSQLAQVFIMQLSSFDSSHRTGVPGTPEVLVPHDAIRFFPRLSTSVGRRYPDADFDVVLNTPTGRERQRYRLWYYETRATGTRIDEYRLRLDHKTVDLTTRGGGDLLVLTKTLEGPNSSYEVTIVGQNDPAFASFFALCKYQVQTKKWGMA